MSRVWDGSHHGPPEPVIADPFNDIKVPAILRKRMVQ
jgi:hypothetical protein